MGDPHFYSRRADRVDPLDGAPPIRRASPFSAGVAVAIAGLAVLILATALNSHSAATPPVVLSVAIDWLHLAATAAWVGGLLSLSVCILPWTRSMEPKRRREMLARLVSRFSNMSLVAVEVLIVTGLYHTWAHVSGPEALSTTPYGQALLVKAALIALALVPAAVNLFIVRPQLAAPTDDTHVERSSRRLGRLIRSEAVVAVGILGAAAMLTSLPPAQLLAAPGQPRLPLWKNNRRSRLSKTQARRYVKMGVSSGQVGSNRIHLSVLGENGEPVTGQAPRIRIEAPPGTGVSTWTVTPAAAADGYVATVDLAPAGQWTLHVLGIGESEATFSFRVPVRGAGEILALADEAMNRLHSAVEESTETISGAVVRSRTEYQAPDRMHRRSDGTRGDRHRKHPLSSSWCDVASGIEPAVPMAGIGTRRRSPGGRAPRHGNAERSGMPGDSVRRQLQRDISANLDRPQGLARDPADRRFEGPYGCHALFGLRQPGQNRAALTRGAAFRLEDFSCVTRPTDNLAAAHNRCAPWPRSKTLD